jgi:hypothetical protein
MPVVILAAPVVCVKNSWTANPRTADLHRYRSLVYLDEVHS